jgi:ADP-heptose:LPS heptosyltransferase
VLQIRYDESMKFLIIRFSSFGDIAQCLSVTALIKAKYPEAQIDFLTKKQFAGLVSMDPQLSKVLSFEASAGILGIYRLSQEIRKSGYTHIYDAHQVMRSKLLLLFLLPWIFLAGVQLKSRSKNRVKRFLYFFLKLKTFDFPFYGSKSFFAPIRDWGQGDFFIRDKNWKFTDKDQAHVESLNLPKNFVVFAPSAAWEMKRWPSSHWKELLKDSSFSVVFLGGPEDSFIEEIVTARTEQTFNFAGKLSLSASALVVYKSSLVVSADTGLLHLADIMNKKTIALMGPTAFGYPSSLNAKVLDLKLSCAPCTKDGRGKCSNSLYQRCMVEIKVEDVLRACNLSLNIRQ